MILFTHQSQRVAQRETGRKVESTARSRVKWRSAEALFRTMARVPPLFLDDHSDVEEGRDDTRDPLPRYNVEKAIGNATYLVTDKYKENEYKVLRRFDFDGCGDTEKHKVKLKLKKMQKEYFHPNIIRIYDIFEAESSIYVVNEYCEGGTLQGVISRAKKQNEILNEIEIMDWMVEILRGLQHLHDLDIIHGNISTGNILLKNNSAKLGSTMEVKRLLNAETLKPAETTASVEDLSVTDIELDEDDALIANLPCYTNPEELQGNPPSDKSDIWAAGCVIYEMCHQKKLFSGSSPDKLESDILSGNIITELPDSYHPELNILWKRMIDLDPTKRPSAFQLLEDPFLLDHAQEMDVPVFTFREEPPQSRLQNVFDACDEEYRDSPDLDDESWLSSLIATSPSPYP